MSDRFSRAVPALVMLLSLAGCTRLDRAIGKVPWFTTMQDQVSIRPYEQPNRLPPVGSVPTWGREDSLDLFTSDLRHLVNPVPATPASLERGHRLYEVYCDVCHGPTGRGDGNVAGKFGYVADLNSDLARQRTDGYLYAITRHGRGIMPRYGDKILDRTDRWNVVNYVRSLQGMR